MAIYQLPVREPPHSIRAARNQSPPPFWSTPASEIREQLSAVREGLSGAEAKLRLDRFGANLLKPRKRSNRLSLLLSQFKSPIVLILLFATALSFFLHDPVNALIILGIVLASGLLGFWQEHSATNAVEKLLTLVQIKVTVLRDGTSCDVPLENIVPGDIVILNAGDRQQRADHRQLVADPKVRIGHAQVRQTAAHGR